ncbi:MAG: recombinase family protein [Streptosporangiaceae bacterium]
MRSHGLSWGRHGSGAVRDQLADAGSHPDKAHAAWRWAHRLDPNPQTAPVVRWIFAQRLDGRSLARITRALNDVCIPCPSAEEGGGLAGKGTRTGRRLGSGDAPACPNSAAHGGAGMLSADFLVGGSA